MQLLLLSVLESGEKAAAEGNADWCVEMCNIYILTLMAAFQSI